jgi:rare lipoprotein A
LQQRPGKFKHAPVAIGHFARYAKKPMRCYLQPLVLLAMIGLAGCATQTPPSAVPPAPPAATAPQSLAPQPFFTQTGVASFYDIGHEGKTTADGESFNPRAFTAAHRTLAFGTVVRVTNLNNGRMVKVTINDRGPQITGRIIDLSSAAARELGITGGIARVKLEAFRADQSGAG